MIKKDGTYSIERLSVFKDGSDSLDFEQELEQLDITELFPKLVKDNNGNSSN
ncbi:hypothetical protein UFOVP67_69 [uncultured Caudovirales phage]|uniref:Uncharacterized protein n=1 Tax=uncultured Caudovirales phage TaxID=2100421 RepID=A0A6J5TCU0_9CAUD|nr:hypothetical protein UFOVP67_69 [uncultured Caudovirales phage]